jgi:hypothetical protein
MRALAEEVASLILRQQEDGRPRWYRDGRVRVLVGKAVIDGPSVPPSLADGGRGFREALWEWMAAEGWLEVGLHVHGPGGSPGSCGS